MNDHLGNGGSDGKESVCNAETEVCSLHWEDPLKKGMTTYSSILAWRIPWTEEPRGLQSMGLQRVGHDSKKKRKGKLGKIKFSVSLDV